MHTSIIIMKLTNNIGRLLATTPKSIDHKPPFLHIG